MHDQLCVLLEFTNEAGKVAVGYQDWLQTKTEETWDDIVKNSSELTFRWPDCDVGPMTSMKKKIKTCEWKSHVAKVLAVGGWTKMCEFRTNLENFGILNPSRADRKLLTTKTDVPKSDVKCRKRKLGTCVDPAKPDCEDNVHCKSSKSKKLLTSLEEQQKHKVCKNLEEESSEDDLSNTKPKDLLTKISVLQAENKMLKEDVARLRTMRALKDDLPTMMQMSRTILGNLKIIKESTSGLAGCEPSLLEHDNSNFYEDVILSDNTADHDKFEDLQIVEKSNNETALLDHYDHASSCEKQQRAAINKNLHKPKPIVTIVTESQQLAPSDKDIRKPKPAVEPVSESRQLALSNKNNCEAKPMDNAISGLNENKIKEELDDLGGMVPAPVRKSQQLAPSNKNVCDIKPVDNAIISGLTENKIKEELMDLGGKGIMVPAASIRKCNHSSFSKLTCDILAILFSKEELSTSSLTGTVSNLHLKKGTPAKTRLDPSKVQAAKAYVLSHFPMVLNAEELFKNTVKQKCNNAIRRGKSAGPATLNASAPAAP